MTKNLVIVESPAKAKTIEGYLGRDFTVKSSYGHVRDLPKGNDSIDIAHGYAPRYEITPDKKEVVSQLRKLAKEADTVWLATDDDREGEAISWHLKEALGLKESHTKRIVFREITKPAILNAIENPRTIDMELVNAQQARRVLDRLVGFEISPILWRKIRTGLSAGRVQSVAVRLIVEREREIEAHNAESFYRVQALLTPQGGKQFKAQLAKKLKDNATASEFVTRCQPGEFSVANLETKPAKRTPAAPFTTSTLQQEASRKLGFGVSKTMMIAQRLYEAGHISYMRTDSVSLSDTAIQGAKKEIASSYGDRYIKFRAYKNKNASAQEAHEAIRPTNFAAHIAGSERDEQRLYELIWKRTIASQMADAELERTVATIGISTTTDTLQATGEVIKFDGFLKVYIESRDDDEEEDEGNEAILPPLTVGQVLNLVEMRATERFSTPAPRYTEASLVKKLEEMGIGRPSTYAPTISTIIKREYVVKDNRDGKKREYQEIVLDRNRQVNQRTLSENVGQEKAKLFPTAVGTVVNDFLTVHFPNIVDFSFTAQVEKEFDEIASGGVEWQNMIDSFYKEFHKKVEESAQLQRSEAGTSRVLGVHPEHGKPVQVRLGRFGPIAQIGDSEGEEKPIFASLKKDQRLETITLDEALELFRLPRAVGEYNGQNITAAIGRFGPYIKVGSAFVSLPKGEDPLSISLDRAIEIYEAKQLAEAQRLIKEFAENPDVKVLNGRWGPYIAVGKANVKIPKDRDPQTLTLEDCLAIAEAAPPPKGGRGRKAEAAKPAAKPKAAAKPRTAKPKAEPGMAMAAEAKPAKPKKASTKPAAAKSATAKTATSKPRKS